MRWIPILLAAILAGCAAPDHETTIEADIPTEAEIGVPFTFPMTIAGDAASTDHLGAHYWTEMQDDPTATIGDSRSCDHQGGELPGDFTVSCTILSPGSFAVYGHARTTDGDHKHDFWSAPQMVHVYPHEEAYAVHADVTGESEGSTSLLVVVEGPEATTDHVGAHYWSEPQDDPTATISDSRACAHGAGTTPLEHTATCTFDAPGEYHVYGHFRVTVNEQKFDYWAEPIIVTA